MAEWIAYGIEDVSEGVELFGLDYKDLMISARKGSVQEEIETAYRSKLNELGVEKKRALDRARWIVSDYTSKLPRGRITLESIERGRQRDEEMFGTRGWLKSLGLTLEDGLTLEE